MVFSEVSRLAYIGMLAVQRICNETTQVGNFTIPKGAKVQINVADIHMNPDLWGPEPVDQFVPERFRLKEKVTDTPWPTCHLVLVPRIVLVCGLPS